MKGLDGGDVRWMVQYYVQCGSYRKRCMHETGKRRDTVGNDLNYLYFHSYVPVYGIEEATKRRTEW